MTPNANLTPTQFLNRPSRALKLALAIVAATGLTACQTVDLGSSKESMKEVAAQPACAVNPGDYKVLAYLNQGSDEKKTARITEVLKKKYAGAGVDANPIVAAQTYVTANSDKSPTELAAMVEAACQ